MTGRSRQPNEGDRVEIRTPDGKETGTVALVMPGQFAVNIDEEFWVYRNSPLGRIPTGARRIVKNDEQWRILS